ncbi:hypothetical protein DO97_00820 [Neosynechococcus sphagnicola sy1]|uniref:Uncharacterized protein n=1 Tax=Neosynechococcus sphagnicola sy1 TaxID=1497020 RepID=A0A098TLT7_9CYAN|nr:hypothetical protein [Neosynechococcus sphagnicola]KGF73275.1 hypothetical protein DO97_00820 [Neosynechococcus sphagnicola sy1]
MSERRRYIRFKDEDQGDILLYVEDETGEKYYFRALIVDESFKGLACVYVGKSQYPPGSLIYWQETDNFTTICQVIRSQEIMERVYFLALERLDLNP